MRLGKETWQKKDTGGTSLPFLRMVIQGLTSYVFTQCVLYTFYRSLKGNNSEKWRNRSQSWRVELGFEHRPPSTVIDHPQRPLFCLLHWPLPGVSSKATLILTGASENSPCEQRRGGPDATGTSRGPRGGRTGVDQTFWPENRGPPSDLFYVLGSHIKRKT